MIVDIANLSNGIEVSYVNDKGGIDIKTYKITDRPYEFPIWELADQVLPSSLISVSMSKKYNLG